MALVNCEHCPSRHHPGSKSQRACQQKAGHTSMGTRSSAHRYAHRTVPTARNGADIRSGGIVDDGATLGNGVVVLSQASVEKSAVVGDGSVLREVSTVEEDAHTGMVDLGGESIIKRSAKIGLDDPTKKVTIGSFSEVAGTVGSGSTIGIRCRVEDGDLRWDKPSSLGPETVVYDNTKIVASQLAGATTVEGYSKLKQCQIGEGSWIGPQANLENVFSRRLQTGAGTRIDYLDDPELTDPDDKPPAIPSMPVSADGPLPGFGTAPANRPPTSGIVAVGIEGHMSEIGVRRTARFGDRVSVHSAHFGENAEVGDHAVFASVTTGGNFRADSNVALDGVTMGDNCQVGQDVSVDESDIGSGAVIESASVMERTSAGDSFRLGSGSQTRPGVTIGDRVTIGQGVTIMDGVNIPSDTNIPVGAGEVSQQDVGRFAGRQ